MKKKVLSAVLLLSVLWNTQGIGGECPKERPFLIREWENENCPEFNVYKLAELKLLELPEWQEIPDYQYNPDKDDKKLLPKLKQIRTELFDLKLKKESLEMEVLQDNDRIEEINQMIKEKNNLFKDKIKIIKEYNEKCEIRHPFVIGNGLALGGGRVFYTPNTSNLQQYIETVKLAIKSNLDEIAEKEKHNLFLRRTNLDYTFWNMKQEKENLVTIPEFEKFYTPEKEKQLLAEYEKALNKVCVGCDYSDLNEYQCGKCPNREYVKGKCVLKKEILNQVQNDNKVKKGEVK